MECAAAVLRRDLNNLHIGQDSPPVPLMEKSPPMDESVPADGVQTPKCQGSSYSASTLDDEVLKMETGLSDRAMFNVVVCYTARFENSFVYHDDWKVESLSLEDQILMTLMKLRHNYTTVHLAQLFQCSYACAMNVVLTFMHVLHSLFFEGVMKTVPSRQKNQSSLPSSFQKYRDCRMIIECMEFEIDTPVSMDLQQQTYSSRKGKHTFKALLGMAPNSTITYCSKLYPGSVSDTTMVTESGILEVFKPGDLILADKGFSIQDIVPEGVTVGDIPPIPIKWASARLEEYKILHFIPHALQSHADVVVQVCCALVNLQIIELD